MEADADYLVMTRAAGPCLTLVGVPQVMKGNNAKYMPGQGPPMPQQCPETGAGYLMGGPFWAEALHDLPGWPASSRPSMCAPLPRV